MTLPKLFKLFGILSEDKIALTAIAQQTGTPVQNVYAVVARGVRNRRVECAIMALMASECLLHRISIRERPSATVISFSKKKHQGEKLPGELGVAVYKTQQIKPGCDIYEALLTVALECPQLVARFLRRRGILVSDVWGQK